jgi:hypothetical protein
MRRPDFEWLELIEASRLITGEGGEIDIAPEHRYAVAIFDNGVALVAKGRREEMAIRYAIDRARKSQYAVHYFVEVEHEVLAAFLAGVTHATGKPIESFGSGVADSGDSGGDSGKLKERLAQYEAWAKELARSVVLATEAVQESRKHTESAQRHMLDLASRFNGNALKTGGR